MKLKKGFTIAEVLVVISIIGILTVVVFPTINNIRAKNRDAEKISDLATIQLGLALYYSQHGSYPPSLSPTVLGSKYVPYDSIISPNSDIYVYIPLNKDSNSEKCTFYHLGVRLELANSQIDRTDNFSTKDLENISNGYEYCGDKPDEITEGIGPSNFETKEYYFNVHP